MQREHGPLPSDTQTPAAGGRPVLQVAAFVFVAACTFAVLLTTAIASPPTAVTEPATAVSYEEATLKGTVNPEGVETVYWFEYGKTEAYGTKIPLTPESVGSGASNVAVAQTVTGLSESTTYHFQVVADGEGEPASGEDETFTTKGFEFSFGETGSEEGQLSEPYGAAVDSKGNVWVTDTGNNRIEEFDSEGKYLSQCGKEGSGNGEFKSPKGIAIDENGHIWVVDSGNARVQEFDAECKYKSQFGKEGTGETEFKSPSGISVVGSGPTVFVADTGNNRVQKLHPNGAVWSIIGKKGSGDGEFISPTGVAVESSQILVTDTGNNRVQRFSNSTYKFSLKFGEKGSGAGQFESPTGIAVDFQGRFWIVDSGNSRVQKFDHEGEYQDQVGESGIGAGQFTNPIGVVASVPQKMLVVDSGNDRVESWLVKAERPDVLKKLATEITATTAVLNASIDPEGLATTYWFEYGETTSYGTKVPVMPESIGSGTAIVKVKQTATGLKPGTTYHFRAVAESSAGRTYGEDTKFKLTAPKVLTLPATEITSTEATLNGKVDPESSATVYWFEYGETSSYGNKIPLTPESAGSGSGYVEVKQRVTGLSKNTTYHFRVVAENEGGTTPGKDVTFKTEP